MTKKCTILLFMLASCIAQGSQAPQDPDKVAKKQRKEAMKALADEKLQAKINKVEQEKAQLIENIKELKIDFEKSRKNFDTSIQLANKQAQEHEQKCMQKERELLECTKTIGILNNNVATQAHNIGLLEDEKTQLNDEITTQKTANETAVKTIKTLKDDLANANTNTGTLITTLRTVNTSLARWKLGSSILAGVTIVSLLGNLLLGYCHSHKCDKADAAQEGSSEASSLEQAPADNQTSVAPVLPEEEPFAQQNTQSDSYFETDADEQDEDEESYPEVISVAADEDPTDLIVAA